MVVPPGAGVPLVFNAVVPASCAPVALEQQAQQAAPPPEDAAASPFVATSVCGGSDFALEIESEAQLAQVQANAQQSLLQSTAVERASSLHAVALRPAPARAMVPFGRLVVQQSVQLHVTATDVTTAGYPAAGASPGGSPAGTDAATTGHPVAGAGSPGGPPAGIGTAAPGSSAIGADFSRSCVGTDVATAGRKPRRRGLTRRSSRRDCRA